MNIFVRNIPIDSTQKQVTNFFRQPLGACGVQYYHADKIPSKPNAILLVYPLEAGQAFLDRHSATSNADYLLWSSKRVYCSHDSLKVPSEFAIKALLYEGAKTRVRALQTQHQPQPEKHESRFQFTSLQCGTWDYTPANGQDHGRLIFGEHYRESRFGTVTFGQKQAIVVLGTPGNSQIRLDINYRDCDSITLDDSVSGPAVLLDLQFPPRIFQLPDALELAMSLFSISRGKKPHIVKKDRIPAINGTHEKIVGLCLVYRVQLADRRTLSKISHLLRHNTKSCSIHMMPCPPFMPVEWIRKTFDRLKMLLSDARHYGGRPFSLRYQIERLAQNARLHPDHIIQLIPKVIDVFESYGLNAASFALRRFYRVVPVPGPNTEAFDCTNAVYEEMLETIAAGYDKHAPDNVYELTKRYSHINLVHRIIVTPTRILLEGPDPEPTNRVLRTYGNHVDHFIRVVFQDEDGSPVRYDPLSTQTTIYHARFKGVLDRSTVIAGRGFSFLGFSHSSLRNRSCWFMAPMVLDGLLNLPPQLIKRLGDFSKFRCPAKCAARIGQNFTDTNATIDLAPEMVGGLPMVQRNGRDFSDGVGTISKELLIRVWYVYGSKRFIKPTALQIRFQGAKGMVALDSRLDGEKLMLRSNMVKFDTATSWNLEICGAGFQPLPMVLNKQFIKIFEDLGIEAEVFMDLQKYAVDNLRRMIEDPIDTPQFLEQEETFKATRLPRLIQLLNEVALDYRDDHFLRSAVEMAVLTKLRDIKYRGRIPVEQGMTLYGIMDETGILKENEIFVVTEKPPLGGGEVLVQNNVVVTRSPAMHPGDIQIVNAVDVPEDSPLRNLSNVVVFSQHGARDMPSKLSGGDLDGDLYNVIYDRRLIPPVTYEPAEYPRVSAQQLDREVNAKDMSDFFVNFMESDQLGMICNLHMQLADQSPFGTLSEQCIRLAGMASTAVDFSKTGVPVDLSMLPRHDPCKPDFMASSPRVFIDENGEIGYEEDDWEVDDAFAGLDAERRPVRYYKSEKILGRLYRAIDEQQFLSDMHQQTTSKEKSIDLAAQLLQYMRYWAKQYAIQYNHQLELARDIRGSYESNLADIAYIFEPSPHMPLTESEIFSGTILGRQGGAQGKPLRELSQTMRQRFAAVVEYATLRIVQGDERMAAAEELDDLFDVYDEREMEALPRAIACLQVAVEETGLEDRMLGPLQSFRYLAAEICLAELKRWRITTLGKRDLPLEGL